MKSEDIQNTNSLRAEILHPWFGNEKLKWKIHLEYGAEKISHKTMQFEKKMDGRKSMEN